MSCVLYFVANISKSERNCSPCVCVCVVWIASSPHKLQFIWLAFFVASVTVVFGSTQIISNQSDRAQSASLLPTKCFSTRNKCITRLEYKHNKASGLIYTVPVSVTRSDRNWVMHSHVWFKQQCSSDRSCNIYQLTCFILRRLFFHHFLSLFSLHITHSVNSHLFFVHIFSSVVRFFRSSVNIYWLLSGSIPLAIYL